MKTAIKVINIIISVCAIISLFVCLVMGGVLDSLKVELETAISSSSGSMTSEQLAEAKYYLAMIDLLSSMYASMYFLLPASAIVGIVGVVVISKATTKKPLIVMGVLTIIFTNVVYIHSKNLGYTLLWHCYTIQSISNFHSTSTVSNDNKLCLI